MSFCGRRPGPTSVVRRPGPLDPATYVALAIAALLAAPLLAQVRYNSGQTIAPVFEGWERNADGTFSMLFGYMNRNYEEELDIPIGPNNRLEPGDPDQGQPTHFFPRRQQFMFKVQVPKDWGDKDLVWTLTHRGHTEKAYATLRDFWEISNNVYHQNRSGPGPQGAPNTGPKATLVGEATRTVGVNQPLPLEMTIEDDGLPAPSARRGGGGTVVPRAPAARGTGPAMTPVPIPPRQNPITQMKVRLDPGMRLGAIWVLHRRGGAGDVTFDPPKAAAVDGKAVTTARFSEPGTYMLRGFADDGILLDYVDVTVTVASR
jgi:hypothetical protein